MKQNLKKGYCKNCIHSTRLYAEISDKWGEYKFKPIKEYCYCTEREIGRYMNGWCKLYIPSYNELNNRLREEDLIEDNLPF